MLENLYLGIDIGGTLIKVAIVNSKGVIFEESVISTDVNAKPADILKSIINIAKKFKDYSKIKSIGVGIAGDVCFGTGVVRFSPNLKKWKNVKVRDILTSLTQKKVYVDNDANTASIGAFWLDAKGKSTDLVCITLGTGVGGGLIFDKKLYRGISGTAGEVGHITIDAYGKKCNCGNRGCIETFVGAKHLSKFVQDYLKDNNSKMIDKLTNKNYKLITPRLLTQAAKKGDKVSKEIWKIVGQKLGIFLSIIINFANPDTVVLCGGISHAKEYFMKYVVKEIQTRAFKSATKACKIIVSEATHNLGVVGAAMLSRQ
ncbi:MAG: ROK family protein [Endomicrobium sp.]|jgi:glucokinase|nr:ROK family protein [Endomicrobium sp.]